MYLSYRIVSFLLILMLSVTFREGRSAPEGAAGNQSGQLRIPFVVILRASQADDDPDLRAYGEAFSAVGLASRVEPTSILTRLPAIDAALLIVIPARTARALTSSEIDRSKQLVASGAVLISEEITPLSEAFGFQKREPVRISRVEELAFPEVEITWQHPVAAAPLLNPPGATILTRDRKSGAALASLFPFGRGQVLLLAIEFDSEKGAGYLRFPYIMQALGRGGVRFPFRREGLVALFDYGYRYGQPIEPLVARWREAGIQALHVGAWEFYDPDSTHDAYLESLIASCHRNGILVYAWLELPHVSLSFWDHHRQWREKTATGKDAHLDWRYLMNLKNEECFKAVAAGISRMIERFDWDGINLAELYFESPDGPRSPGAFTPLNQEVRREFQGLTGVDPLNYFRRASPHFWKTNPGSWAKFVDYRVEQERLLNERFLQLFTDLRATAKPNLDLILLYIDNIYDPKMREGVGADIKEILPLLDRYEITLVMEDPGTVWHLGPRRYAELGQSYAGMTRHTDRLGIDINVVDRQQEVYPTKKQTGTEFLQLFHYAAANFKTVMVYSEQTMMDQDIALVANAMASGVTGESSEKGININTSQPVTFRTGLTSADINVDGNPWPCNSKGDILLPAGSHVVSIANDSGARRPRLLKLNGDLKKAGYIGSQGIEISYESRARAIALFDRAPKSVVVDGASLAGTPADWVMLPGGSHVVLVTF